jgi:hypothetical protein
MDSDFWNLCRCLGDSLSPFVLILCLNVLGTLSLVLGEPLRIFQITLNRGESPRHAETTAGGHAGHLPRQEP